MKKSALLILILMLCTGSFVSVKAAESGKTSNESTESSKGKEGDFYFAYFDVNTQNNIKAAIPGLVLRFYGTIESINPADLTDLVLTRDGVKVNNSISYNNKVVNFTWGYEEVTDVYFSFKTNNRKTGNYGLTGKYKGESFQVYNKFVETPINKNPALAKNLISVYWSYSRDENNNITSVNEVGFEFKGRQNTFYPSNLKDLVLTLDGKEIPFSFSQFISRYFEANQDNTGDTSYHLILKKALTKPGTYCLTGKYRGKVFKTDEIIIPAEEDSSDSNSSKKGDFYLAYMDSVVIDNRIASIKGLYVRFYGDIESIKLSDFTDIKLKKDGVTVKTDTILYPGAGQFQYGNEDVTDFYIQFENEIVEPGYYTLTGKYKGKTFDAGTVTIEAELSDLPAASKDLVEVSWSYLTDDQHNPVKTNEVSFTFLGLQNQFKRSDLTDLKLTRDGKNISFELLEREPFATMKQLVVTLVIPDFIYSLRKICLKQVLIVSVENTKGKPLLRLS